MKSTRLVFGCVLVALLLLASGWVMASAQQSTVQSLPSPAKEAIGTSFTFQGQLTYNSRPITDNCLMRFKLFNAASAGDQVGPSYSPLAAVPVQSGLFTVVLDFGSVYDGTALWLQIEVKCTTDVDYVNLGRQRLTSAPQAVNAQYLGGNASSFYQDASNLLAGTLGADRFSAFADLTAEGYLGDAAGDLAQNNGTLQTSLNADKLDGVEGTYYERSYLEGTINSGNSLIIEIPEWYPFTLQLGSGWPDYGGVAFITGIANDYYIAVTYIIYDGDGTSHYGGAECYEGDTTTLVQFGQGLYIYRVKCPGEGTGVDNLVLDATNAAVELRYKVIY